MTAVGRGGHPTMWRRWEETNDVGGARAAAFFLSVCACFAVNAEGPVRPCAHVSHSLWVCLPPNHGECLPVLLSVTSYVGTLLAFAADAWPHPDRGSNEGKDQW